ncbi:MAG: S-layer homology domain-containing protein [Clostridia bacterium]|nr:S-layer homology domain-containing protein [Clostridia bacterium]
MKIGKLRNILLFSVFILCLSLFFSSTVAVAAAGNAKIFSDVPKHWAQKSINAWVERGYIGGYPNGKFMPDKTISRAEFCAIINRVFGYRQGSFLNFPDVPKGKWFAQELDKAVAAGYLSNYPGGVIKPNNEITRQEVAVALTKVLSLPAVTQDLYSKFEDLEKITLDEAMAINSVLKYKYMSEYTNKMFAPNKGVTRAEMLTILDRAVGTLYDQPGIYGTPYDTLVVNGNVTINTSNVTLRNVFITGDLYLTEGIGEGSVVLANVTVKGVTKVGGGVMINDSKLGSVIVASAYGRQLRLLAQGTTAIGPLDVRTAAKLEEANLVGTGFTNAMFKVPQGAKLEMKGSFRQVDVESSKVKLNFSQGIIENLNLNLAAQDTEVILFSGVTVKNLRAINKAAIKGWGTINSADVYARGVTFEIIPKTVRVASGATAIVNGKTVTGPQSSSSSSGGYSNKSIPFFVDGYPKVTNVRTTRFDLLLKADETCNAYYVVLESGGRVPSAKDIMAGQDARGRIVPQNYRGQARIKGNAVVSVGIRELEDATRYDVFVVLENRGTDIEPAVTKVTVRTVER